MADNIELPGTGQVVATKDLGGVEYQVILLADGSYTVVAPATSGKQDLLYTLIETLQELIQRLSPLASAITLVGGQSLRVSQTAVPSTAVTGPITSANSIAQKALGGVMFTMRVAQENMAAIQSNLNNITAK